MHCGDQGHLGLCLGYVPALAYGSCRVSDQGTTLRASDLHNARSTILNPFNKVQTGLCGGTRWCSGGCQTDNHHAAANKDLVNQVASLSKEVLGLKTALADWDATIAQLQGEVQGLRLQKDALEQYGRRSSLRIMGISEDHEDTTEAVVNLANEVLQLDPKLEEKDIDVSQEGYNCLHKFCKEKRGGGLSLYVANGIDFMNRPDLEYFDSEMESLFIEAEGSNFNLSSNIIIAVIYRMPNTSLDIFNDRIASILNTITREDKLCYFLGNLNIDLLKHENHNPTSGLLDIMYSYNMFPLITKPTRVTKDTATLIDHTFTNNFKTDQSMYKKYYAPVYHIILLCSILRVMEAKAPCVILNLLLGETCAMPIYSSSGMKCQLLIGGRYWVRVMPK